MPEHLPLCASVEDLLPGPCRLCAWWQTAGIARVSPATAAAVRRRWTSSLEDDWGYPGLIRLAQVGTADSSRWVVHYAPAASLPRLRDLLFAQMPSDAVVLFCLRGDGLADPLAARQMAAQLLHMALKQLKQQRCREVYALGCPDGGAPQEERCEFFSRAFLLPRPLLKAISADAPVVLLVDEVDRADEEFEAFLLEVLSDYQVSIPELGTLRAKRPPRVILTSNDSRDLSDALRRRCLYLYVDYPSPEEELRIVESRIPGLSTELGERLVRFAQSVRKADLRKQPGVSEVLDWALALVVVGAGSLSAPVLRRTLGALLKNREDLEQVLADLSRYR